MSIQISCSPQKSLFSLASLSFVFPHSWFVYTRPILSILSHLLVPVLSYFHLVVARVSSQILSEPSLAHPPSLLSIPSLLHTVQERPVLDSQLAL